MDGANFFTSLRTLAIKVENESRIFEERMHMPPQQRRANGSTADNILKEMQFDAHKLKNEAKKELEREQEQTSFKHVLAACENLLQVNQKQASSLKEYLIQYGYQTSKQHTKPAKLTKQTTKQTGEDKENKQADTDRPDDLCPPADHLTRPVKEPTTPEKGETNTSSRNESVTPKMEDFGLSMNRVNLFLKKGIQSSFQPKALDDSDAGRVTPIEKTVVYGNTDLTSLEDSELIAGDEGPHHPWLQSDTVPEKLPSKNTPKEKAIVSQSCTPDTPNITSWFLQEPSKPPVAPLVTHHPEDTFTPSTPDCQTTQLFNMVPQEPKRLVDTIEMMEPQEPHQYSSCVVNNTPEIPACIADPSYNQQQVPESGMYTPPQIKKGPPHMSFLQQDATPKTPELTMSFSQLCRQPIPKGSFQQTSTASYHQQESYSYIQPAVVPKTNTTSYNASGFFVLAPITQEEFNSLSAKIRQNLSLEKVNEWLQILDNHIARKPQEEKFLSQEDLDALQVYPWLRAALMLLAGGFNRLEKMELPGFADPVYIPL